MKVLVACEESQTICIAFRERGHEAFSCDISSCSGGHPEWHILGDVVPLLNGNCTFTTESHDTYVHQGEWELIIAHPPCTHLSSSGARWFSEKQKDFRQQTACVFFMYFALARCDRICIENPVGIMSTVYRKPDQIVQPYMFGDPYEKTTCLWLKGLPQLEPTEIVTPEPRQVLYNGKTLPTWYSNAHGDRAKVRSKTFPGIAKAMAEQWG